jgi:predicted phosphodiesterase
MLKQACKERADTLVCLGDIVGHGPFPNECIARERQQGEIVLRGNHDTAAVNGIPLEDCDADRRIAMEWTRSKLTPEHSGHIQKLPIIHTSMDVTSVHAAPRDPDRWTYVSMWQDAHLADHIKTFPTGFIV